MTNFLDENTLRTYYEKNPIINSLNHKFPALFRVGWELYLFVRKLRMPHNQADLPLSPITPLIQAQRWGEPPSNLPQAEKHVHLFNFTGWSTMTVWNGVLARSLELRGARTSFFTCGGLLPVCYIQTSASGVPPMPCGRCRAYVDSGLKSFGYQTPQLRHLVSEAERKQIEAEITLLQPDKLAEYEYQKIRFGEFASVSTRWFLLDTQLELTPEVIQRMREFILLGRLTYAAVQRLFDNDCPDHVVMFNGLQVAEQVVRAICEQRDIPYVCLERGYLANTVMAVHGEAASRFPFDSAWEMYKSQPLEPVQREKLITYLNQRRYGAGQMDNIWEGIEERADILRKELSLQPGRPVVAAFTNVAGDTAILDRELGYDDIREWIDHMIEIFSRRPDVDLIFRIHPAESRKARYKPRLSFGDYIRNKYPELPPNIKIIPSSSALSSYTLLDLADLVLVYTSSMGLEAAALGKPVVVSARVHYSGKGFTHDIVTKADAEAMLMSWDAKSGFPPASAEMAQRYLYIFYYRMMMPFDAVMSEGLFGRMKLELTGWHDLAPGKIPVIDTLCDGILTGKAFINPFES